VAFAERFTAVTGLTPMTYLLRWRMALAKDSIAHGDRSHTQIAYAVGYSSINSFSTAFKRHVGQSPAQFARTLTGR
jgi:AraC-like DNA-binding protein